MLKNDQAVLCGNELFSALPQELLEKWLSEGICETLSCKKGDVVLSEENFRRCLIVILKGRVSVLRLDAEGHRTVLNELSKGDVFGMATLFTEDEEYPSQILAEESSRLLIFPKELIEEAFSRSPDFSLAYVRLLSRKIRFLNRKLSSFTESETGEKLLRFLENASGGKQEFLLPCSVSRLSEILGIGRASVYRAFDLLTEQGKISRNGKAVILHPEKS